MTLFINYHRRNMNCIIKERKGLPKGSRIRSCVRNKELITSGVSKYVTVA